MSKDTINIQTPGERPTNDPVTIRAFRFDFWHALAFAAIPMLFVLGAGAVLSFSRFSGELFGYDAVLSSMPATVERSAYRLTPEQSSDEQFDAASNSSPYNNSDQALPTERDPDRERRIAQAESELTQVFASINRGDPRQMRNFLTAYGDDPLAQELGYIDAVKRSVSERQLLVPDAVVTCGDCWCLREAPASVKASTVTQ